MSFESHMRRGLSSESEVIERVEGNYGKLFDALAKLRDVAISDLAALGWTQNEFTRFPAILVLLLSQGIGVLDLSRIALEHGYGRRARILVRALIDLEIDAALLSTQDPGLTFRYSAFEAWELAVRATTGADRIEDADLLAQGLKLRNESLAEALVGASIEVPDGFGSLDLRDAAELFAKMVFDSKYPSTWRRPLTRRQWLQMAVEQIALVDQSETFVNQFGDSKEGIRWELEFAYSWCSDAVHVSPRTVAESVVFDDDSEMTGFVVGGHPGDVPGSCLMAMLHFSRLRMLVAEHVDFATDEDEWHAIYKDV